MINLLEETKENLKEHGKTPEDIIWIGSSDGKYVTDWEGFSAIANKEYSPGYGTNEVNAGLVIVGKDWWMERGEYDGSEWWDFKSIPVNDGLSQPCMNVFVKDYSDCWKALND